MQVRETVKEIYRYIRDFIIAWMVKPYYMDFLRRELEYQRYKQIRERYEKEHFKGENHEIQNNRCKKTGKQE